MKTIKEALEKIYDYIENNSDGCDIIFPFVELSSGEVVSSLCISPYSTSDIIVNDTFDDKSEIKYLHNYPTVDICKIYNELFESDYIPRKNQNDKKSEDVIIEPMSTIQLIKDTIVDMFQNGELKIVPKSSRNPYCDHDSHSISIMYGDTEIAKYTED